MTTPTAWTWPVPPRIAAIANLEELEAVTDDFTRQAGYEPELLSHWDPKPEFQPTIESWLDPHAGSFSQVLYAYSIYLDVDEANLKKRLGEPSDRGLLPTASGTTSIATVLLHLKNLGFDHLSVVTPAYFAIEALCQALGLAISFTPVQRQQGRYILPTSIEFGSRSVVWLTLPVFGTSCYIDPASVASFIDKLPAELAVVMDESLAFIDRPSLSETITLDRVFRIVTPNKAVCINGEKVSLIGAPRSLIDSLNDWSECVVGGIGTSGLNALAFLRGPGFPLAVAKARGLQAALKNRMKDVLSGLSAFELDEDTDGHFVMVYWPKLPMALLEKRAELMRLMTETGASAIPASRNKHPEQYGLSFRVNLMRLDNAGLGALRRFAVALETASSAASRSA